MLIIASCNWFKLVQAGDEYFVELRARSSMPSNYSSLFSVIDERLGMTLGA